MPSRPTLITPLDSEITPPSAANKSSMAYRSVAATSADHVNTDSSVDTAELDRCRGAGDREQGHNDRLGSNLALAAGD